MPLHPLNIRVARVQLETPATLDASVAEVVVPALLFAQHQGAFELLQYHVLEVGGGDDDQDVDDVFAHESWYCGTAHVFDGEVGDFGAGEVEGELFFDFFEVRGPRFLVLVDPDVDHDGGTWL